MRVRQSVRVTKAKHPRVDQVGIIETLIGADAQGLNPKKIAVRFDDPEPAGELVEFAAGEVTLLPGSN